MDFWTVTLGHRVALPYSRRVCLLPPEKRTDSMEPYIQIKITSRLASAGVRKGLFDLATAPANVVSDRSEDDSSTAGAEEALLLSLRAAFPATSV